MTFDMVVEKSSTVDSIYSGNKGQETAELLQIVNYGKMAKSITYFRTMRTAC